MREQPLFMGVGSEIYIIQQPQLPPSLQLHNVNTLIYADSGALRAKMDVTEIRDGM